MREVAAIAVAVVVGYFLGPSAGIAAGAMVYNAMAPNAKAEGPRLSDLKAPHADYGAVIPYIEGAPCTAGTYIWYSDKIEIATETSDNDVDITTYTYEMNVLILFSINELSALRRVWSHGKLIWNASGEADEGTLDASLVTTAWREIIFYSGADDQMPDPTYEAAVGIGNAPAYRGRGSVMIKGLNLGQSGQLPALKFEVVSGNAGVPTNVAGTVYTITMPQEITNQSGVASFVGPGHSFYPPKFGASYLTRDFFVVTDRPLGPAITGEGLLPATDDTINFKTGMSDESYWSASGNNLGEYTIYDSNGSGISGRPEYATSSKYSRCNGSTLYLLGGSPPYTTLPRGIGDGGDVTATAYNPYSATYYAGEWYVLPGPADGFIYRYLKDTAPPYGLIANGTIADPRTVGDVFGNLTADTVTGDLYLSTGALVRRWSGAAWSDYLTGLPGVMHGTSAGAAPTGITMVGGILYALSYVTAAGVTTYTLSRARSMSVVTGDTSVPLDDVFKRLSLRTGTIGLDDIDVTDLAGLRLRAMAVSQVVPTRQVMETLMAAHMIEAVVSDKIKFVKRGGASVATIPYEDMGATTGEWVEPLPVRRVNDMERPARATVKFANMLNDFQDGAETGDRLITDSTAIAIFEMPIGMFPVEAKRVADILTMDAAVTLIGIGPVSLTRKYPQLEPSDVVHLTGKDGSTYRSRIQKTTIAESIVTHEFVLDDATIINSLANTAEGYASSNLILSVTATEQRLLDIPILRETDDNAGLYDQVKGDAEWSGASIYSSTDGASYAREVDITEPAVFGTCSTTLGPWTGPRVFDETNMVTVNVGTGTLSSSTRDAMLNDQAVNACAIGIHGRWELMQFRDAALLGPGLYTLSGFLRGSRGTEWAMTGHTAYESFSLLRTAGMRRIPMSSSQLGTTRYYKPVSVGRSVASTTAETLINMGVGLKPFSPFDVRAARDAATGDITLTWQRRTRLTTRTTGPLGISVPLGEAIESYAVDVFASSAYAVIKRPLTSSTTSVVYTSAQQVADFGSNQSMVYVKVFQLSAVVGRGTPAQAAA